MPRKKKKRSLAPYLVLIAVMIMLSAVALYFYKRTSRTKFAHYTGFGIDLPVNYTFHGIDVSKHQSVIAWKDVQGMKDNGVNLSFVFMKATEGVDDEDPQFKRNWKQADKFHLARGAYHFFIASKSGKTQALNFIRSVQLKPGDLPPVLDVELTFGMPVKALQQRVSDWLQIIERQYHVRPVIYTNADFYQHYLSGAFDGYPLWVAHYLVKDKPRIQREWTFWQHSETGHVNGIGTFVDFNVFSGDSAAFEALKIK